MGGRVRPLPIAAARYPWRAAQLADGVLVAMFVDLGVLHRDPLAKYAVVFCRLLHQLRFGQFYAQAAVLDLQFADGPACAGVSWSWRIRRFVSSH